MTGVQTCALPIYEINTLQRRRSGNILFAVSTGLTNSLPYDAIERFNEQSTTGAHVEITRDLVDYDCESNLYEKTCDFALLNDPIDHTMFSSLPILKDRMHLVVKSDCPLAPKAMICGTDWIRCGVILWWCPAKRIISPP